MSSELSVKYCSEQRLKDIIRGINKDFEQQIIDNLFNDIKVTTNNGIHSKTDLTDIERDINELKQNVLTLKEDGNEKRFLEFENNCRKLLKTLDAIVLDTDLERNRRKRDIDAIKDCSSKLKILSINNLRELLSFVRNKDYKNNYQTICREIEEFIEKSSKSTLTSVDNQRYLLEDIKQKLLKQN